MSPAHDSFFVEFSELSNVCNSCALLLDRAVSFAISFSPHSRHPVAPKTRKSPFSTKNHFLFCLESFSYHLLTLFFTGSQQVYERNKRKAFSHSASKVKISSVHLHSASFKKIVQASKTESLIKHGSSRET